MRYSDLAGKEIIDIDQGVRLGIVNETDVIIDTRTGRVQSIVIPFRTGLWQRREIVIPWHGIKRIGVDLIIVDLSTATNRPELGEPGEERRSSPALRRVRNGNEDRSAR